MMRSNREWKELADDLERLLKNRVDAEFIWNKYANRPLSVSTERIMANVDHFLSDDDIRTKDTRYKQMQETEMAKLIALLRAEGPLEDILEIHFLGETKPRPEP